MTYLASSSDLGHGIRSLRKVQMDPMPSDSAKVPGRATRKDPASVKQLPTGLRLAIYEDLCETSVRDDLHASSKTLMLSSKPYLEPETYLEGAPDEV